MYKLQFYLGCWCAYVLYYSRFIAISFPVGLDRWLKSIKHTRVLCCQSVLWLKKSGEVSKKIIIVPTSSWQMTLSALISSALINWNQGFHRISVKMIQSEHRELPGSGTCSERKAYTPCGEELCVVTCIVDSRTQKKIVDQSIEFSEHKLSSCLFYFSWG